ncbi:Protein of unknown function [Bacillus cytotoxicus]|uniref:Uncharacterized protein n=1 Tax=Bacillus cytotoxicus TaxID=580165 RepID=A0AAX2CFF9_9BACI|nr:Protein of unknown function [Bacillus cytotoxicus]SCN34709.1 Protein of unknown function [Bacillus cytotoxicus]
MCHSISNTAAFGDHVTG